MPDQPSGVNLSDEAVPRAGRDARVLRIGVALSTSMQTSRGKCRHKTTVEQCGKERCEVKLIMATTMATVLALMPLLAADDEPAQRLDEAAAVLSEIMATPDKGIPEDLLANAHCIVIVPSLKTAAFGLGGKYGKGYLSCRNKSGAGWSAPATVRIEGGSVGFQIGGSSTDLIMLVMSERGADKLLSSKFTLGAEGSVAAGPVGRTATAQTDAQMHADILSWSRSQGCLPASPWKEPRCARIWMTTPRCTARNWRTATS